jgi:hypothetical protein
VLATLEESYQDCTMSYFNVSSCAVVTQYYLAIQKACTGEFLKEEFGNFPFFLFGNPFLILLNFFILQLLPIPNTVEFQNLSELKQQVLNCGWTDSIEMLIHISMAAAEHLVVDQVSVMLQSRDGDDFCAQISSLTQVRGRRE